MGSGEVLAALERCPRIAYWATQWKPNKLQPVEMVEAGVRAALLEVTRSDPGEVAGEEVYALGSDPGIDSKQFDQHSEVVHLACVADAIASAIRRPGSAPWRLAPDLPHWQSGCFLSPDGAHLRRVAYVTSWNDDRHYALCRSWETLGEVCAHGLPMQLLVAVLGAHREGKYHSYWTHGLLHPSGQRTPRFRKRNKVEEGFKGSWVECWRENRDDISTAQWLEGMLQDGVLRDCLVKIDIAVPKAEQRQRIADLAATKLAIMQQNTHALPLQNLSTCDWPAPCRFRTPCHAQQEPGPAYGFVRANAVGSRR